MKKKNVFILALLILMLITVTSIAFILKSALAERTVGHDYAEKVAMENGVKKIEEISTYNSDNVYYVVKGKNHEDKSVIAFVPKNEKKRVHMFLADKGLTKEDVLELVSSYDPDKKPKEIISIEIGYDDSQKPKWDIPVWEVRYKDEKNRYTYFIVSFTDSKVYKSYSIQQ